jgi:cardiolipin synthase
MLIWFETHFAVLLGMILALVAIANLLRKRRSPTSLIAWLLVIVLLPYIGVPLYLMLGGRKMNRIAESKSKIKLNERQILPLERASIIDRGLRACGIPAATSSNRMELCLTGEDAYCKLVEMIEGAQRSIYIAIFIFAEDEVGFDILERLCRKASRGIKVRLLLDGVGSLKTSHTFLEPLVSCGGRYEFFMPVFRRPLRGRTNLRNHRKIVIIDECRAWAGGQNIADEYIGPGTKNERWKDLSFVVQGPAVIPFMEVFRSDWLFASDEDLHLHPEAVCANLDDNGVLQVVPSGPDLIHDGLYEAILSSVFAARKRLWLVTPYFVPDEALNQGLVIAAHRGVDVRIIVPEKSNHFMADVVRSGYLREIQAAGGLIMMYKGMLHAKVMLMDETLAMIGSANLDSRSLFLNYEVATFVYSTQEIMDITDWLEKMSEDTVPGIKKAGRLRGLFEGVAQIISPQV